ncbi:hypothetical protein [Draconibacterium halophilum]|uniref:Uncharacterized protein n=1 Tax=Draconibacterium halophilum TaxID=2706887 RepID=A0A6C0REG8_9BACT|nr:hypothetical protein [Draconibacterium halophilum]QIA08065.1 hypothetical protein G0Q07_10145 [Draconibacterium halophilum]
MAASAYFSKMKKQLQKGADVVITSGLLKAIQNDIVELRAEDKDALINDFGFWGSTDKDILIPKVL